MAALEGCRCPLVLSRVVRELELGVCEANRDLFGEQRRWPNGQACGNGRYDCGSRGRDRRKLRIRIWNGCHDGGHDDIARRAGMIIESRADVAQHDHAREDGGKGAKSQVALGMHQLLAMAFLQARFEPMGKVCRRRDRRQVSEEQQRPADLGIVLRATLAFSNVPLHANQLDTGQRIVYKSKVLITKLATIHGDRLRVRKQVPANGEPVPEPTNLIYVWGNDFRERVSCPI